MFTAENVPTITLSRALSTLALPQAKAWPLQSRVRSLRARLAISHLPLIAVALFAAAGNAHAAPPPLAPPHEQHVVTPSPKTSQSILVLGDSLSAEYGLPRGTGWVPLLGKRLAASGDKTYSVSNGSISGDTSSGGLSRLPALLNRVQPAIVIVELGANDALRGIPITTTRTNLSAIITLAQTHKAKVLLIGMQIPPNYGPVYTRAFAALYPTLSKQYGTGLVPFLLNGIADKPEMFQADQIHPLPEAQPALLENVWEPLQSLIHAKPHSGT